MGKDTELLQKLMEKVSDVKDFNVLDGIFTDNDVVFVDKRVQNKINKDELVHESDLDGNDQLNTNKFVIDAKKKALTYQRFFTLSRAILVHPDKVYESIVNRFWPLGPRKKEVENMEKQIYKSMFFDSTDNEEEMRKFAELLESDPEAAKLKVAGSEEKMRNIALDAKAAVITQGFLYESGDYDNFRNAFGNNGMLSTLVDGAYKADKAFLKNCNNPYAILNIDDNFQSEIGHIDDVSDKEIDNVSDNYVSQGKYVALYDRNAENTEKQEMLKDKEAIRIRQNERNNRSWAWKIFGFIPNIINYFSIKNQKDAFIKKYIEPKYKDDDGKIYDREGYDESVRKLNDDANKEAAFVYQEKPTERTVNPANEMDQVAFQDQVKGNVSENNIQINNVKAKGKDDLEASKEEIKIDVPKQ